MRVMMVLMETLLLVSLVVLPASAFTLDNLHISVLNEGQAEITLNYTLSWLEDIAVFFKVVDPAEEIQKTIEQSTGKTSQIEQVTSRSAVFIVEEYVTIEMAEGRITQTTPRLDFTQADQYLKNQWWSILVSQDLSPTTSTVLFSDGFLQTYTEVLEIPAITHTLGS
jgi:hypothetical protein